MMTGKIEFKYGGRMWTAIYNKEYELIDVLDGDGQSNFQSINAVDKAEDAVFELMMTSKKYRRRTKPMKEVKDGE